MTLGGACCENSKREKIFKIETKEQIHLRSKRDWPPTVSFFLFYSTIAGKLPARNKLHLKKEMVLKTVNEHFICGAERTLQIAKADKAQLLDSAK